MDGDAQILLDKLSKQYGGAKERALDAVSLKVMPGETYGFLGANGAGKSTTIRTLLNFIQPTSGSATILGMDVVKDSVAIKRRVGYLAGDVALYEKQTGEQFLRFMAKLQPLADPAYFDTLVKGFKAELHKPISDLSKGNRQKLGIIQALMHQPDVLILDEPTSGLDPLMQEVFFDAVRQAKERGASVFFSSHNLGEVQRVCDRIGFIRAGRLIQEQSIAELTKNASHTFDVTFAHDAPLAEFKHIRDAQLTATQDTKHVSILVPNGSLKQFFGILARHQVQQFQQRELNLEEEFLNFYKGDVNEK